MMLNAAVATGMTLTDTLHNYSAEELLGECIMPRLNIEKFVPGTEYAEHVRRLVSEHLVGGLCVFGGSPDSVRNSLLELESIAMSSHGIPLLFSADCEFGLPMRLTTGGTEFPDAMAIAQTGNPELAFRIGHAIGDEMRSLGLNWNLAPVVDVNSNPLNPIINTRSFGEQPAIVSQFAVEYIKGLRRSGIAATAKHFPGHGDTNIDSHRDLPIIHRGLAEFESVELPPFRSAIQSGVDSVMPGHLSTPELAQALGASDVESELPATLSPTLLNGLLREELGFKGVIVSDAMEMKAITDNYGERQAIVAAFSAGIDMILLPITPHLANEALREAFKSGKITEHKIRQSATRILALKQRVCISRPQPALSELEYSHAQLAKLTATHAIQLKGSIDLTPATLVILADDRPETIRKATLFQELVSERLPHSRLMTVHEWSEDYELSNSTIIATFHRARGYIDGSSSEVTMDSVMTGIANRYANIGESPRGLIEFGSPYVDRPFQLQPSFVLKSFSESIASVEAIATILR